jgi:aldose 1-epimerase
MLKIDSRKVSALALSTALLAMGAVGCESQKPAPPPSATAELKPAATAPAPTEAATATAKPKAAPKVEKEVFGDIDNGTAVELYTLKEGGLTMKVMTYGAIVKELHVPDKSGKLADVVLGFDRVEDYVKSSPYFGATVGRVANRIKNASFELDGKRYKLAANDKPHTLHGGTKGWDKVVWNAEPSESAEGAALKLTYVSKDGEEGYPGNLTATTIYTLTPKGEFKVEMSAVSDKKTLVNMAHHSYWNLGGHASGPITSHELTLFAKSYTPATGLVPDGRVSAVQGTPFDFTSAKAIGKDLQAAGGKPIGFDHNWVVDGDPHTMRPVAKLKDPASGRVMTIEADQPGVQFYSGNFLDGKAVGKGGVAYQQYTGLCLETQKFPNSVNVPAWRNEVVLEPGQTYKHTMVHRFTAE